MSAGSRVRRLLVEPAKRLVGPLRWALWRMRYWALRHKIVDLAENRRWRVSSPRIIIVSEASASRHAYWYFLDWLGRERPSLRAHIHLDRLPCRLPPGAALLHAWVQDPVVERAPRVHMWLVRLEAECARRGVTVVHPAGVLSNSKRDVLCERASRHTPRVEANLMADIQRAPSLPEPL